MGLFIALTAGVVGFYLAVFRRTLNDFKSAADRLSELSGKRWHDIRNLTVAAMLFACLVYVALHT